MKPPRKKRRDRRLLSHRPWRQKGIGGRADYRRSVHPLDQTSRQLLQTMLDALRQPESGVSLQRTIPFEILTPGSRGPCVGRAGAKAEASPTSCSLSNEIVMKGRLPYDVTSFAHACTRAGASEITRTRARIYGAAFAELGRRHGTSDGPRLLRPMQQPVPGPRGRLPR